MWQSCVGIEDYSITLCSKCHATKIPLRGGTYNRFVDNLTEVQRYRVSNTAIQSKYVMEKSLHRTVTHSALRLCCSNLTSLATEVNEVPPRWILIWVNFDLT